MSNDPKDWDPDFTMVMGEVDEWEPLMVRVPRAFRERLDAIERGEVVAEPKPGYLTVSAGKPGSWNTAMDHGADEALTGLIKRSMNEVMDRWTTGIIERMFSLLTSSRSKSTNGETAQGNGGSSSSSDEEVLDTRFLRRITAAMRKQGSKRT